MSLRLENSAKKWWGGPLVRAGPLGKATARANARAKGYLVTSLDPLFASTTGRQAWARPRTRERTRGSAPRYSNQRRPRTRTVSPGAQSGNTGSEWRHGHCAFPHTRWQRSHDVHIRLSPFAERTAATGCFQILFSAVWALNSGAPFSMTQIWVRSRVNGSLVPLRRNSSMFTSHSVG